MKYEVQIMNRNALIAWFLIEFSEHIMPMSDATQELFAGKINDSNYLIKMLRRKYPNINIVFDTHETLITL